jgi:hypothetical protein
MKNKISYWKWLFTNPLLYIFTALYYIFMKLPKGLDSIGYEIKRFPESFFGELTGTFFIIVIILSIYYYFKYRK